ncbi:ABC transporter substrate-binding protein [Candidatus Caldatribacterium sp. SIUC1]|uniref:ABC transporter substrate-binding protein n=1 Tax=Candidatus Caldatribacterium sp. SIUC1 TaxID=3418365 RepID=UPI003F68FF0A
MRRRILPFSVLCFFLLLPSAFGLEVTDDTGRTVTLSCPASRVVSLTPANTEIVFALGAEGSLVGVTTYCDYPEEAKKKEKVGSITEVDLEAIVRLEPDLVLAGSLTPPEVVDRLTKLGYPVFVLDPKSISQVIEGIRKVALLLGKEKEGEALAQAMEENVQEIQARVSGLPEEEKPRVFHVIWHDPLWTAGKDTFIHEFITLAGGENVVEDLSGYVTLDLEELLRRNPDIITVVSTHGENLPYNFIVSDTRLRVLQAVRQGRVFVVDSDIVSRPGPRVTEALRIFASIIHPEIFGPYQSSKE